MTVRTTLLVLACLLCGCARKPAVQAPAATTPTPAAQAATPTPAGGGPRQAAVVQSDFHVPFFRGAQVVGMARQQVPGEGRTVTMQVARLETAATLDEVAAYYQLVLPGSQRTTEGDVLFLHPLGTRPGQILSQGSRVALVRRGDKTQVTLEDFEP